MSIDWGSAIAIGGSAFLYAAVVRPCLSAYGRWKNDPNREIVYRQDIFGRFVPDLRRKRIERVLLTFLMLVFVAGLWIDWVIMTTPPKGSWLDPTTNTFHLAVPPPQKGR